MRTAGKFFGGRRVDLEPIDFAPQVVRLEVSVGFRRDPRIARWALRRQAGWSSLTTAFARSISNLRLAVPVEVVALRRHEIQDELLRRDRALRGTR